VSCAGNCAGAVSAWARSVARLSTASNLLAEDLPEAARRRVGKVFQSGQALRVLDFPLKAGHCMIAMPQGQ